MFDGLLGKKFTVKCKSAIKCINERLRPIRNRKQAVVNILRKDVAELLRNGGDAQAFSRMDELLVEMNRLACYDMIDSFCQRIYKQLPVLQKQSDCLPEEQESVATLIFAAARFSDLPELSNLRAAFTMRYGNHMEGFVNPEFKEKVVTKTFPSTSKIKLMEDIAFEFGVLWNPKSFNQKNPSASAPNPQAKINGISGEKETVKKTTNKIRAGAPENTSPSPLARPREDDLQRKNTDTNFRASQPFRARDEDEHGMKMMPPDLGPQPVSVRKSPRAQARVNAIGSEESPKNINNTSAADVGTKVNPRLMQDKHAVETEQVVDRQRSSRNQATVSTADVAAPPSATKERTLRSVPPPYVKTIGPKVVPHEKNARPAAVKVDVTPAQVNGQRAKPRSVRRKPLQTEQGRSIHDAVEEARVDSDFDHDDVDHLLAFYSKKRTGAERRRQEGKGKEQIDRGEVDDLAERFTRLRWTRVG